MKRTLIFLMLWGMWGFALGTVLLMGPARWIVNYIRLHNYSDKMESGAMITCIIVLVFISFLIAWRSTNSFLQSSFKSLSIALIAIPLISASLALAAFMNPKIMNAGNGQENFGKGFTIGPYPDKEKMAVLKKEGYTTIISLLHPGVVPFEPRLLSIEQKNAKEVGIRLLHIPMLPWIADNEASINSLRQFAKTNKDKCYVHCYLGKDRVNVARRIIEQTNGNATIEIQKPTHRKLENKKRFERGPIFKLEENVFLTPMPTNEEYLAFILASDFKQIVNLINTKDPLAKIYIEEEKKNLTALGIQYKVYDVNETTDAASMDIIVKEVKMLPKPMLIHPFFSESIEAKLFLQAYKKTL